MVLFIMMYKLVLTFASVNETLVFDCSNIEQYFHVALFTMLHKVVLTLQSMKEP